MKIVLLIAAFLNFSNAHAQSADLEACDVEYSKYEERYNKAREEMRAELKKIIGVLTEEEKKKFTDLYSSFAELGVDASDKSKEKRSGIVHEQARATNFLVYDMYRNNDVHLQQRWQDLVTDLGARGYDLSLSNPYMFGKARGLRTFDLFKHLLVNEDKTTTVIEAELIIGAPEAEVIIFNKERAESYTSKYWVWDQLSKECKEQIRQPSRKENVFYMLHYPGKNGRSAMAVDWK